MSNFWYDNAIVYHIYPLGFCGAPKYNEGGEVQYRLNKLVDWIPHLKEMNVDAVYLGPVFESVEHGYDTIDYKTVDRRLGDNASFKDNCRQLHENGIKIILDGVFNHVGRGFEKFKDIQQNGQNSPYCGWFHNLNFGGQSPCGDNFWYEGWNGHYNLVKLNLRNPEVCDYLIDVVDFWMNEFEIDGIRFDAADCIEFDFFKRIRSHCKGKNPEFWLMGEIIFGDYKRWANPEMLDSVTNYECYKGIYSSHNTKNYFEIDYSINRQSGSNAIYPGINLYNFVDNHDVNRIASTLTNPEHIYNVYTMLYAMPGIPSIYYGGEYGVKGIKENNSDDNLRPCLNLGDMNSENTKLYAHIVKLGRIYRAYPALRTGKYHTIIIRNQQMLFLKELNGQQVYVALNLEDRDFDLSFGTDRPALVDVLSGNRVNVENGNAYIKMPPFSSMIIVEDAIVNEEPEPIHEEKPTETEIVIGGKYRHYKGGEYELISVVKHSETLEELVIYKSLSTGEMWARPKSLFVGLVDGQSRYTLL